MRKHIHSAAISHLHDLTLHKFCHSLNGHRYETPVHISIEHDWSGCVPIVGHVWPTYGAKELSSAEIATLTKATELLVTEMAAEKLPGLPIRFIWS